ncbi:hypothetical protein CVT26_007224, partial [Gymnopilus dilepis]
MPPRLNKRQQRELEELEALKAASTPAADGEEEQESDEDPGPSQRKGGGVFMNFLPAEGSDDEEEEEEVKSSKAKKSKKKKKKASSTPTPVPTTTTTDPKPDTAAPSPSPSAPQPTKDKAPVQPPKESSPTPSHPALDKSSKKAQKKARQKEKKAAELNGSDEIDKALAELSLQYVSLLRSAALTFLHPKLIFYVFASFRYPSSQKPTSATTTPTSHLPPLPTLLTTSLPHLDPDAEMRRFFGSRVVLASRSSESPSTASTSNTSGRGRKTQGVKSNLVRPGANWWPAKAREGLTLREEGDQEIKDLCTRRGWREAHGEGKEKERWWTVEYSRKYLGVTKAFMGAVMSGDPQGLYDLLGVLPWHADTLLQISEIYRHREEHAQATDFTDRALFTYERAFMGAFAFTTGLNRLDFDRVENRPFFLGVHQQVADLQRRGCVRTAFEFARLLYSLDPWTDPHGATLHLDFLAVKAGMNEWLLDVYDVFEARRAGAEGRESKEEKGTGPDGRLNPALLPGWAYARALAMRAREEGKGEDHTASTDALKEAARDFPSVVPLLADKLDVALPAHVRAHRDFRVVTDATSLSPAESILHLLSHLYVQRSHPLWKDPSLTSWFSSTITSTFPSPLPSSLPTTGRRKALLQQYTNKNLQYSVYRHVMVLEAGLRRLFGFLPREVVDVKSLSCDPLPPPSALTTYDTTFFAPLSSSPSPFPPRARTRTRRQQALDDRRLAQLIPDAPFREQLRAFFDANRDAWGDRFPGGVLQFAQVVAQMPGEVLEG